METTHLNPPTIPLSNKKQTVVIVVTLDTRAPAAKFLRDEITSWDINTILIDPGILGEPGIQGDITRWQVAEAAGTTLDALLNTGVQSVCIEKQTEGLCYIAQKLYSEGKLDGIISLGGDLGTSMGAAAMRTLPLGVPKLMLSTSACGTFQFRPYVGTKDICIMHSVTDILDVNAINRPILRNAANAIAGMVLRSDANKVEEKQIIGITELDMTTPCVLRVKRLLETQGYQVAPFYADGWGGTAMEESIQGGKFSGVIDLSVHEIIDYLFHGIAGANHRLEALTRTKIPAIVSLGGNDHLLFGSIDKAPENLQQRPKFVLNPRVTVFQPTVDEMESAARYMLDPLNRALGPTIVLVPSVGFSDINQPGRELWFPEGNQAAIRVLQEGLRPEVPVIVVDAHINQPVFSDVIAVCMSRLLAGEDPQSIAARYRFK